LAFLGVFSEAQWNNGAFEPSQLVDLHPVQSNDSLFRVQTTQETSYGPVTLDILINPDPVIRYTIDVTNLHTAPVVVTLILNADLFTPPGLYVAKSEFGGELVDIDGNGVAWDSANDFHTPQLADITDGLGILHSDAGQPCAFAASVPLTTHDCGIDRRVLTSLSKNPTFITTQVSFFLSAHDRAVIHGGVELLPDAPTHGPVSQVPEPTSLFLFGTAALGLGTLRRTGNPS
jgi:hypothetical protein